MASRTEARFSTYSGAPSIQPSLAPTYQTSNSSARNSQTTTTYLAPQSGVVYGDRIYGGSDPSAMASTSTLNPSDPKSADIKSWSGTLERMHEPRLDKQRYVMNNEKSEEVSKIALGAKVERALARRMVGQDATFRVKKTIDSEKRNVEVEAN